MKRMFLVFFVGAQSVYAGEPVPAAGQQAVNPGAPKDVTLGETVVAETKTPTEHDKVGAYGQPRWTDRRRFPGVRLYVAPPGAATFEYWMDAKWKSDSSPTRLRTTYEMSFGLGYRLQLDLYVRTQSLGSDVMAIESERIELRYALADYGKLWGNPTLYFEFIRKTQGPHRMEGKLLLGGELHPRLFWGVNFFFESEIFSAEKVREYGAVAGVAYSVMDSKLSLGAETRLEMVDNAASQRIPLEWEWLVGPSVSFRPLPQAHVLFTAYVGPGFERETTRAPFSVRWVFQPTLVMGWRF